MPDKEFLEQYSLFKKFKAEVPSPLAYIPQPPINMKCMTCDSEQTFSKAGVLYGHQTQSNHQSNGKLINLRYLCQSCKSFSREFLIRTSENLDFYFKYGQFPEWEIKMDKRLEKMLGKHSKTYRNGLVCESQGYGIGAFAYYRRITEEIIDELLNSITDLLEPSQKERYKEALEKTKNTTITSEKIELVKDLLPQSLRPSNMNPLSILHSELSKGLHGQSDESCLESAGNIKKILTYLVKRISESQQDSAEFSEGMKAFLDKKSGK